jgi:site-specific DNA-methyltransferase (adenine-specific)
VDRRPVDDLLLLGDNLDLLPGFADGLFQLVYADPPFNTGRDQRRQTLAMEADPSGDRTGFAGRRYRTRVLAEASYRDSFDD